LPSNPKLSKPTTIVGSVLDIVVVSHAAEGMICDKYEGRVNIYNVLYCFLQRLMVSPPQF
jgi:hypothetical protein